MELQLPRDNRDNAVQRKDSMVKVRIKCRAEGQVIPGGYVLPRGESTCLVYAPDLPIIKRMVEPAPDRILNASAYFDRAVEDEVKEELKDITDDEAKAARLARARQEFHGSVEGMFHFLEKRDILPLESIEVLQENIPAPVQEQAVDQQTFLAATIAREVATALAAVLPGIMAAAANPPAATTAPATKPQQR